MGIEPMDQDYGTGVNVFGVLPATTDTTQTIVIGAHYDTVRNSPGANDNASGVAAVLGAACRVAAVPERDAHLLIVLFDEEERGRLGSVAFAEMLAASERTVTSVHTVDQVGWDDDGDGLIELERASAEIETMYREANERLNEPMVLSSSPIGASDHVSFTDQGFEAVGVTEAFFAGDTTPFVDLPRDTPRTVNFEFLSRLTTLLAGVVSAEVCPETSACGSG